MNKGFYGNGLIITSAFMLQNLFVNEGLYANERFCGAGLFINKSPYANKGLLAAILWRRVTFFFKSFKDRAGIFRISPPQRPPL